MRTAGSGRPRSAAGILLLAAGAAVIEAHGVTGQGRDFRAGHHRGRPIGPFLYLGAKHMVTGYDHLLFLVGVIFFLYRMKDVVLTSPCSRSAIASRCSPACSAASM